MRKSIPDPNWPQSWRESYEYDGLEVYGASGCIGYSYAYQKRRDETLRLMQRAAAPPARVLDVAAAQGNFSLALAEMGYEVTWNDLRADLADYVRLKHEHGALHFAPGNVFDLRCEPFDVVLITEVIEHVAHPDQFLAQIARLVKPGGHVVMTTPNGGYFLNTLPKFSECKDASSFEAVQFKPNSDGHIFLLHEEEIAPLAHQAGLKVETVKIFTNPLTNGHIKTEPILRHLPGSIVNAVELWTEALPKPAMRRLHTAMAVLLARVN